MPNLQSYWEEKVNSNPSLSARHIVGVQEGHGAAVLNQDDCVPQGPFSNIWRCFWLLNDAGGLLACVERPGM